MLFAWQVTLTAAVLIVTLTVAVANVRLTAAVLTVTLSAVCGMQLVGALAGVAGAHGLVHRGSRLRVLAGSGHTYIEQPGRHTHTHTHTHTGSI